MKRYRKKFIEFLFEITSKAYTNLFKNNTPWDVTKDSLLMYKKDTLGYNLGKFLDKNSFELIPKVERHDCYHVICGYSTKVEDEIALQYLCLANGKRSLYVYGAVILGTIILPDYYNYYYQSFKIGKEANKFHHYDFKELLDVSIDEFRKIIFSKSQLQIIKSQNI